MSQAYIVAAARSAGGRRNGRLTGWHPADLGGTIIDALLERAQADPATVDDVIFGCVTQAGEQSQNVARSAVLSSRLPIRVPGVTVDRQCGSSQQAIHFAAQAVMSGSMDIVIAGGVESMTRVPMMTAARALQEEGHAEYRGERFLKRFPGRAPDQFSSAETIAAKYGFKRSEMDAFAYDSHRKAADATRRGAFSGQIIGLPIVTDEGPATHEVDEGIRMETTLAAISQVKLLTEGGRLTAATSSQICDGAAAVLVVNEAGLKKLGAKPTARIHHMTVWGDDPVTMLEAPIPATRVALDRCGLKIGDIDLYEVNEAFASIPMAWVQALQADPSRLNVNGGAIALGHPLGASGARLMTTLLYELQARKGRFGLQAMCEGGGLANVTLVERL